MKRITTSLFCVLFICYFPILGKTQANLSDSLALIALYNSTNGADWYYDTAIYYYGPWDLDQPIHTWRGVTVNTEGRVTELYLPASGLDGYIPPEIGNLDQLKKLNLRGGVFEAFSSNYLSGPIPPEIGNLTNLEELRLGNICFNCWSLNQLVGNIPVEISQLTKLRHLDLGGLGLKGEIPPEFGNLINLEYLELSSNYLSGSIPDELGDLNNLTQLYLSNNQINGGIPSVIGNLSNLVHLHLYDNQLNGNIPVPVGNLTNLRELFLDNNRLTGYIPTFSSTSNLNLYIRYNKFSFEYIDATYNSNTPPQPFHYSPQYHGEVQSHVIALDTTLVLELSTPLPGNNNQNVSYQWKKDDIELAGSTDSTFTINNLQISDIGKYTLYMTDSTRIPNLEVISEPIYVIVPGYDLYGQPVVYNQIMMQFDNEADKQSYENEHLFPNGGWVQDDCSCNRGLYLWQFPSETTALQILLDINTKRENQDTKADVDGGPNNIFNLGISNNSGTAWSWTSDYTGHTYQDSVRIFMLDSGLDEANWDASPYLLPDAPKDSCYNITAPGYDYTDSLVTFTTNYVDSLGHGTFGFRSVVEGLSDHMDVKSIPLRVFDQSGQGTLFKFTCALYHAIDHDADVINISAGYRGEPSEILAEAVQLAQQKGIFIVTAAGNDGENIDNSPQFPAYFSGTTYEQDIGDVIHDIPYDNVISVASINAQDSLSVFSNYGSNTTTLAAYGENMSGYGVGGVSVVSSGTSMSTFYVTRELAAEIAKDKSRSLQDIWSDFEVNKLINNPPTNGLTKTGKRLDIQIVNTCLPTLTPSGNIADGTYQAGQIIDSNGTISMGSNVQFKAGDIITLQPGFQVEQQSEFSVEIEDCSGNQ